MDETKYIQMAGIYEELLCSICQERPRNKIIDCGSHHSFCDECITKWQAQKKNTCPLCRGEFCIPPGGVKNLPEDHGVRGLLSKLQELETESGVQLKEESLCAQCIDPKQPASATCDKCGNICVGCVTDHEKKRIYADHTVHGIGGCPAPQTTLMGLTIKDVEDKTISVTIDVTATLRQLKEIIFNKTGVQIGQQWLVCCGKQFDNNDLDKELVKDLKIKKDATIHLLLKGHGGGKN